MLIDESSILYYKYTFSKGNSVLGEFEIKLDKDTLVIVKDKPGNIPDWALLEQFKCPNCPLNSSEYEYCPLAEKIIDIIEFFRDSFSYEEVDITVESQNRSYYKHTRMQYGISSLMGLIMPTSGCPILAKLKPMARFHLPFSSIEETSYRAMSTYLLGQYFLKKQGVTPDWDMKELVHFYKDIQIVNRNLWKKWQDIIKEDASINALVILDTFADYVLLTIDDITLSEIEQLFNVYADNMTK